jgi:hypothetical protein
VKEPVKGVPMVAPAVSRAVQTTVPAPALTEVEKLQGGVSVPVRTTAVCAEPDESVTTQLMEAWAALVVGRGVVVVPTWTRTGSSTADINKLQCEVEKSGEVNT